MSLMTCPTANAICSCHCFVTILQVLLMRQVPCSQVLAMQLALTSPGWQ